MTITQEKLLTFKCVAGLTGISRTTMKRMTECGKFPQPVKVGGKIAYVSSEIDAWINERISERDVVHTIG